VKAEANEETSILCIMEWETTAAFLKILTEDSAELTADVKNYTAGTPKIVYGEIVGSG
jgi:hypothetical protein